MQSVFTVCMYMNVCMYSIYVCAACICVCTVCLQVELPLSPLCSEGRSREGSKVSFVEGCVHRRWYKVVSIEGCVHRN